MCVKYLDCLIDTDMDFSEKEMSFYDEHVMQPIRNRVACHYGFLDSDARKLFQLYSCEALPANFHMKIHSIPVEKAAAGFDDSLPALLHGRFVMDSRNKEE